jgi:DNA-binding transcriptional MocR family regulator
MNVVLDPEQLRYQMAIRNLDGVSLAQAAGVSKNTISRALQPLAIRRSSLRQIASGLLTLPPLRMVEDLVAKPEGTVMLTGAPQPRRPLGSAPPAGVGTS